MTSSEPPTWQQPSTCRHERMAEAHSIGRGLERIVCLDCGRTIDRDTPNDKRVT